MLKSVAKKYRISRRLIGSKVVVHSRQESYFYFLCNFLVTHCVKLGEMSTRKGGDNARKRPAGADKYNEEAEETVSVGSTVNVSGRAARSRKPVKIELERDEDNTEESEYFKKELKEAKVLKKRKGEKPESMSPPAKEVVNSADAKPPSSPSPKKKHVEPVKVEPPNNWEKMLENIQIMRSTKTAAVDTMGCERTADLSQEPKVQRFHTLVSLMLSSQTRDQVTFAAMERLKERNLTVQKMIDIDEKDLAEILKPVGFFNRKAIYIKKAAGILREKYSDDIPKTIEDLCALPGVGPKMAYICMNAAWHENAGIGVDTHVHRISNRLKWTGKKGTSTPEKTREALESWLPKDMWQEINILLVGFGQEICLPIGPKCGTCLNKDICPSAEISRKSKKK